MSHHKIKVACTSCKATGLYVGMGERDGAAVVCHTCKGTGESTLEYDDFTGRKPKPGVVKRVYQVNPGICIGTGNGHRLEDFGGISYAEWNSGQGFPKRGSENREFTCPKWWYQSEDYKRGPDWKECDNTLGSTFSSCPYFKTKDRCWARFDEEKR